MPDASPEFHPSHPATTHLNHLGELLGAPYSQLPRRSTAVLLMKHGGFQIMLRPAAMMAKLKRHLPPTVNEADRAALAVTLAKPAEMFFTRLDKVHRYGIPSQLMSYITFPHEGKVYTEPDAVEDENPNIPAVFTFIGQFVDHDLTFNGSNLYDVQSDDILKPSMAKDVLNFASPQIDLDSVYGSRNYGDANQADPKTTVGYDQVFNTNGSFKLVKLAPNAYDLRREMDPSTPNLVGAAYIFDPRNDENQIILQIHLLVMRVHNRYLPQVYLDNPTLDPTNKADGMQAAELARREVVHTWQRMLLDDYLPRVCKRSVLTETESAVHHAVNTNDWSKLNYKPDEHGLLQMIHEFALAFRFGHSMLRTAYRLNGFGPVQLFNNRDIQRKGDLRGGGPLPLSHVIDWDIFFPSNEFDASLSLKIDRKVTPVVFDLPESAIPDAIKTTGNLPERNLVRSREIDLACGEDLAQLFGLTPLDRFQIEPSDSAHYLFEADVDTYLHPDGTGVPPGNPDEGYKDTRFKTPLWYYVLSEAEITQSGERLGELGSHIVSQVIVVGIHIGPYAQPSNYASKILGGKKTVMLRNLIDYVNDNPPQYI